MNNQDDMLIADYNSYFANETDRHCLDSYIVQLRDYAIKIRNRETPPPKGQISGIFISVVLIIIFEVFLVDSEDGFFFGAFMGIILVRICWTGRYTIAELYECAAAALESFRDTGSIPEIENRKDCLEYINFVIDTCREGLGDNTVRTPKQWLKNIRKETQTY